MAVFLMSIKPWFGEDILKGTKKFELRRFVGGQIRPGDAVYLYFSSPVRAIMGKFTVGSVCVAPVVQLRELVSKLGEIGVGEEDWMYVTGSRLAMIIEVREPQPCARPIDPKSLGLKPPLSYYRLSKTASILVEQCGRPNSYYNTNNLKG